MAALDAIMNNMPVANQRRQQQVQAANDLQLQQAIKAVPPKAATPAVAQNLGAAVQQNVGQQMIETAKQNMQQTQQVGDLAVQEKQANIQNNLAALKRGQDTTQLADEQKFANLNEEAKRTMFDNRMEFQKDEQGRAYMNERQLADYAVAHAKSVDQLKDYAQSAEQMAQRKMQALEVAQAKIDQELEFQNSLSIQKQDQALKKQLVQAKADLEKKIAKDKAKAANKSGMMSTVGGIAGAAVGAYVTAGSPAGAMVGAGSALGAAAASQ